jgi:spermidine synthase
VALTAAAVTAMMIAAPFAIARLTSGVYRHGLLEDSPNAKFPFYRDGRTATVNVEVSENGFVTIATNGKPDASMDGAWLATVAPPKPLALTTDVASQFLLPLITLAHNPGAQEMAVIGFGSGMSSHTLLGSPHAKEVVAIEIEPEMIEGSRHFLPANRRAYEDPRIRYVIDDAKSYFASSGRRFDLILSVPSNPWVSGVSGLFTIEFYDRIKRQLADNGVFGQWFQLYELNDGLVHSVIAAIDTTFADFEVFYTSGNNILVVAANQTLRAPDWGVANFPSLRHDLARAIAFTPEWFETLRLGGKEVLHPLLIAQGEPSSDFFPTIDLNAEKMRFMHVSAIGYRDLANGRFDVVAALRGRRRDFGSALDSPTPQVARSEAYALAARLQRWRRNGAGDPDVGDSESFRVALNRVDRIERGAQGSRPPGDWRAWMRDVVTADAELHSGTAGVVDTTFFRTIRAYATRARAPQEVRSSLDFLHGIGAWNWPEAATAAKALMMSENPNVWIPPDLLRNGATTAFMMIGDTSSAKAVLRLYRQYGENRLGERILAALLTAP